MCNFNVDFSKIFWGHPRPPTASLSPRLGVHISQPHPKTAITIISGTAKAIRISNLGRTFIKNFGKVAVGVLRDSKFFRAPRGHLCDSSAFLFRHLRKKAFSNQFSSSLYTAAYARTGAGVWLFSYCRFSSVRTEWTELQIEARNPDRSQAI